MAEESNDEKQMVNGMVNLHLALLVKLIYDLPVYDVEYMFLK